MIAAFGACSIRPEGIIIRAGESQEGPMKTSFVSFEQRLLVLNGR